MRVNQTSRDLHTYSHEVLLLILLQVTFLLCPIWKTLKYKDLVRKQKHHVQDANIYLIKSKTTLQQTLLFPKGTVQLDKSDNPIQQLGRKTSPVHSNCPFAIYEFSECK